MSNEDGSGRLPGPTPSFTLHDVKLNAFNFSTATSSLTSNLQITISYGNPSFEAGIYFEQFDVYASYKTQQITLPTMIPPTYLGLNENNTPWSTYLNGTEVPVPPDVAASLARDVTAGELWIDVKANGRLRSKNAWIRTARYRVKVICPAYIMLGNKNGSNAVGSAVHLQPFVEGCRIS
ncbi:hypothetical protein L1987_56487 [Smallanthus sonchifolius]|uniref:Uncharacterized protein n=1 Tax=Smallanthus sonchifolius TaxID=185202 RepID=A0ACB9EDC0_9ASTR|nr:hypothetical protein L1987_56487 [Smallanthus sonchifolius]